MHILLPQSLPGASVFYQIIKRVITADFIGMYTPLAGKESLVLKDISVTELESRQKNPVKNRQLYHFLDVRKS